MSLLLDSCHSALCRPLQRTSSSSGGESSCEDGAPWGSPAPRLHIPDPHSSSEHSANNLIYVGPNQNRRNIAAPPPFIPIIPSLNKKWLMEERGSGSISGNHFKCNTFAELQEKLDCVDGPCATQTEVPGTAEPASHDPGQEPPTDPLTAGLLEASGSRAEKSLAPPPAAAVAVVDQSGLLSGSSTAGPLRTTVTLQRPVQLNREDELVFTLVADVSSGRMSDLPGSSRGRSLQAVTSGWQPVSIISSITDEYESFTSLPGCQKPGTSPINRRDSDPSRSGASPSAWKPSSGQVTFRRPAAGPSSSMTKLLKSLGPGCERGDSLIQPAATTLAFRNLEEPSGTTWSTTLRKKPNLLKDLRISKKLSVDQKSRTALPPSASKMSQDVPRPSTTEEELLHRSSRGLTLIGQRSYTSRCPLKAHNAKQQSSRFHSLNSLKKTSGGRISRSHLTSTSTSATFQDPPVGLRSSSRGDKQSHTGRGTFPGTKLTVSRRLLHLAAVSRGKQSGGRSHHRGTGSGAGREAPPPSLPPPSPYSKVTAPRRHRISSVLSSELQPAMVCTTLLHHKGGANSSGYGSSTTVHDSETPPLSSDRRPPSSNQSRAFKLPRKRGSGEWRGWGRRGGGHRK